jgi:hypothetical protein
LTNASDHTSGLCEPAMTDYGARADSLAGALIGHLAVLSREKPAKRVFYVCRNVRDGSTHRLRGYELVEMAREARRNGLAVVMAKPWRDEPGAA